MLLARQVLLSSEKDPPGGTESNSVDVASPSAPHATALPSRRGPRARGNSVASASQGAAEEGRALFDADEEHSIVSGRRGDAAASGGKWELGDSDDEEDEDVNVGGKATEGSQRTASENPWESDADADEKDPIVRR